MSAPIITIEGLGKRYTLHHQGGSGLLRDQLATLLRNPFRKAKTERATAEEFWALRDLNFTINQGDVVGIIGRNGAGKSTLLKILSRITEPTTGRITIQGRVASLLEVGTGFHGELSGRENIYLNGAILGMKRAEIRRKFDEIVAFSEVEKFLDTPVKHYSSGMYVRLAFAVAAHLEPEILIVDEVLAVGDMAFQRKCLGKMQDVARTEGRTVLFVSHNMDSILRLCRSGIVLKSGCVAYCGAPTGAVAMYAHAESRPAHAIDCKSLERPNWTRRRLSLRKVEHLDAAAPAWTVPFGGTLEFVCELDSQGESEEWQLFLAFFSVSGVEAAATQSIRLPMVPSGSVRLHCKLENFRLTPGNYLVNLGVQAEGKMEDFVAEAMCIEVLPTADSAMLHADAFRGFYVPQASYWLP